MVYGGCNCITNKVLMIVLDQQEIRMVQLSISICGLKCCVGAMLSVIM